MIQLEDKRPFKKAMVNTRKEILTHPHTYTHSTAQLVSNGCITELQRANLANIYINIYTHTHISMFN